MCLNHRVNVAHTQAGALTCYGPLPSWYQGPVFPDSAACCEAPGLQTMDISESGMGKGGQEKREKGGWETISIVEQLLRKNRFLQQAFQWKQKDPECGGYSTVLHCHGNSGNS